MTFYKTKFLVIMIIAGISFAAMPVSAQKYKTLADTAKLNKEYISFKADIDDLNKQLTDAKGKTADLETKVGSTQDDSKASALESKDQASKATNGNLGDIKKEEKKARKANNQAHDARDAKNDLKDNQEKIKDLTKKIEKKQQQLADLEKQRTAIMGQANTPPVNP